MKKINYFMLPLLVVPFLASCGSSKAKSEKVTEQEFNDAVTMKNVEYLQIHQDETTTTTYEGKIKQAEVDTTRLISPVAYHRIDNIMEIGAPNDYYELYSTGNKNECNYIQRENKDGGFSSPTHVTFEDTDYKIYFPTPQYYALPIFGLSFKEFKYANNGYVYNGEPISGYRVDISICFAEKKAINYTMNYAIDQEGFKTSSKTTGELTYNETVPADPSK